MRAGRNKKEREKALSSTLAGRGDDRAIDGQSSAGRFPRNDPGRRLLLKGVMASQRGYGYLDDIDVSDVKSGKGVANVCGNLEIQGVDNDIDIRI